MADASCIDHERLEEERCESELGHASIYLFKVKTRFSDDGQTYRAFLRAFEMYRKGEMSTGEVCKEVLSLFKDHKDLVVGFSYYLPEAKPLVGPAPIHQDGLDFAVKVKMRLANEEQKYKAFREVLKMYRNGQKHGNEMLNEVLMLLWEHEDLIEGFTWFLPRAWSNDGGQQQGFFVSAAGFSVPYWERCWES